MGSGQDHLLANILQVLRVVWIPYNCNFICAPQSFRQPQHVYAAFLNQNNLWSAVFQRRLQLYSEVFIFLQVLVFYAQLFQSRILRMYPIFWRLVCST